MHLSALALSALLSTATAWLPGEHKRIVSRVGVNLFDRKSLYDAGRVRKRFLPIDYGNDKGKIRGVNLGSLFVLENWLADDMMPGWGCPTTSEFDCVSALGQSQANADFQSHWGAWITADDFTRMVAYGLNTVRIPV
jgi:glucan endo-1,6-beta-glucosidase